MRKRMFLLGLTFLLLGVLAESYYVIDTRAAYNGPTLTANASMITGILFILFGFILTISSARIPQIRIPGQS